MISLSDIKAYVRALCESFEPDKVIFFGSYAKGCPSENSDVDLLIIMEHENERNVDQAVSIRLWRNAGFPLDLIVRRPSDIKERLHVRDTFIADIMNNGQVLYG